MAMQRTWNVNGVYAKWTLTVTVEPPVDDPQDFDVPAWPRERIDPVASHFIEAVNHYEVCKDAERFYR
jgi:hypothetical protein